MCVFFLPWFLLFSFWTLISGRKYFCWSTLKTLGKHFYFPSVEFGHVTVPSSFDSSEEPSGLPKGLDPLFQTHSQGIKQWSQTKAPLIKSKINSFHFNGGCRVFHSHFTGDLFQRGGKKWERLQCWLCGGVSSSLMYSRCLHVNVCTSRLWQHSLFLGSNGCWAEPGF